MMVGTLTLFRQRERLEAGAAGEESGKQAVRSKGTHQSAKYLLAADPRSHFNWDTQRKEATAHGVAND